MTELSSVEVQAVNGGLVHMIAFSVAVIGVAVIHKYTK